MSTGTSFRLASYNVLATSYIRPEFYPATPAELLADEHRVPALVRYIADLHADLYCLQEVERYAFAAIEAALGPMGYEAQLARKGGRRPDGCAVLFRLTCFRPVSAERLEYEEGLGPSPSGHVAQLIVLECGSRQIGVANTHLRWDPPGVPPARQHGLRQVRELLSVLRSDPYRGMPWIICGDLNASPSSAVVQALLDAGLTYSHTAPHEGATCNANRTAKMIDYVFTEAPLQARPHPVVPVDDATPLPGPTQPSDHVPVIAQVGWE